MAPISNEPALHGAPISVFHTVIKRMDPHPQLSHTDHQLSYLAKGSIHLEHGRELTIPVGAITIVPAGVPHRLLSGDGLDVWGVGFCAPCLDLDEDRPLMHPFKRVRLGGLPIIPIASARRRRVVQLFRQLEEECERPGRCVPELRLCLLKLILGEVDRATTLDDTAPNDGTLVADALAFIQQHCFEAISLRDVAASVHRTPAHVATTVKDATGFSVGRWIAAGKAAEAAARLAHTDDSLDAIASHVGWQDTTHFIRQFKKFYGATPAAWRREQRGKHSRAH